MSVRSTAIEAEIYPARRRRRAFARSAASDHGSGGSTGAAREGVSQNGQTCHSGSSGALQPEHDSRSRVVQTGQTRKPGSTAERHTGQRSSAGRSAWRAFISSSRSLTSSRYSGGTEQHVDERADEGRHEPEHRRHGDEPRVLNAAARVLVRPVAHGEPEDDDEEEQQVARDEPRLRVEEVGEKGDVSYQQFRYPPRESCEPESRTPR